MNKLQKLLCATLSLALMASMVACGGASTGGSSAPGASGSSAAAGSTAPADYSKTKLLVYTNGGTDGRAEWLMERGKQDGFNLEVVNMGGGDLLNRLLAEKNNQVADAIYGLNPMQFEILKTENLLFSFEPTWMGEVDMTLGDNKDHTYFPTAVQPLLIAYNKDVVSNPPKDWIDLATNLEYAGKHNILALGGGTCRNCIGGVLQKYRDPNGELGVSQAGWDVMQQYIENGVLVADGEDWFGKAVSGERPITQIWGSGFIQNVEATGATNMDYVVPEGGVPYVTEQTAVFKNSKNVEAATAFVNWFGSAKIQGEWSAKFGSAPVHPEALKMAPAAVQEMMGKLKPEPYDWAFVGENIEKWMEKIMLEFVK